MCVCVRARQKQPTQPILGDICVDLTCIWSCSAVADLYYYNHELWLTLTISYVTVYNGMYHNVIYNSADP